MREIYFLIKTLAWALLGTKFLLLVAVFFAGWFGGANREILRCKEEQKQFYHASKELYKGAIKINEMLKDIGRNGFYVKEKQDGH